MVSAKVQKVNRIILVFWSSPKLTWIAPLPLSPNGMGGGFPVNYLCVVGDRSATDMPHVSSVFRFPRCSPHDDSGGQEVSNMLGIFNCSLFLNLPSVLLHAKLFASWPHVRKSWKARRTWKLNSIRWSKLRISPHVDIDSVERALILHHRITTSLWR